MVGFRATVGTGLRQIAFLLIPAASSPRCSPSRSCASSTSAARSPTGRRSSPEPRGLPPASSSTAGCCCSPGLLRPPVELDPDLGRGRQARPQRRSRRRVLPPRGLGDPARDVARQHRRRRGPRLLPPPPRPRGRPARISNAVVRITRRVRCPRRRCVRHLVGARQRARPLVGAQIVSLGAALVSGRRRTSAPAGCCGCVSSTRSARPCRAARWRRVAGRRERR